MDRSQAEAVAASVLAFLSKWEIGDHDPYKIKALVKAIKKFDVQWVNTNNTFYVTGWDKKEVIKARNTLYKAAKKLYDDRVGIVTHFGKGIWDIGLKGKDSTWRGGIYFLDFTGTPRGMEPGPETLKRSIDPYTPRRS